MLGIDMATSVKALVRPELLVWARESAKLGRAEAAHKAQVKEDQLLAWETGDDQPSLPQLRKLGKVYKRPLAVFYLPKPPKDFDALRDFRRLPQEALGKQSPALAFEVRRARARREIALDLYQELTGTAPKAFKQAANLGEDAEAVGARLREALGVGQAEMAGWKTEYDAFNRWRGALEEAGALVFQAEDVEVAEMRGFSVSERVFPAIVVNIKDAVVGRIFTMLHEAAHLMLREGGICDLVEEGARAQQRIEAYCNRVAAATLMPGTSILAEEVVRRHRGSEWSDPDIEVLARRYRVSREATVRRLLTLGKTSQEFYRQKRKELLQELEAQRREAEERKAQGLEVGGFAPPDRLAVSRSGPLFVRLVLDSYHQEKITANDLSSFLDVRLKHLAKIEHAVLDRPAGLVPHV